MERLLLGLLIACTMAVARGQGILGRTDERALDYFSQTVTAPLDLPTEYAVVLRMGTLTLHPNAGLAESDWILIYSERRRERQRLERFSAWRLKNLKDDSPSDPIWDQRLILGNEILSRSGNPTSRYARQLSQSRDVSVENAVIRSRERQHYPLFFPLAISYDWIMGRVDENYGDLLLQRYSLANSKLGENGLIESTWTSKKREARIAFDPSQGGRPSKIVYMSSANFDTDKIEAIHEIRWEKWRWGRDQHCWVPTHFRRVVSESASKAESEAECYLQWKNTTDRSVIPAAKDTDWREPTRQLFDEDWTLDLPDWARLNAPEDHKS